MSFFVLSPLILMLLVGFVVGFVILMIKLFKNNPQAALILLIVPIAGIAIFVLLKLFGSGASHSVPFFDGAPHIIPPLGLLSLMLVAGLVVGFIILMIKLIKSNPKNTAILLIVPVVLSVLSILASMFVVSKPVRSSYSDTVTTTVRPRVSEAATPFGSSPDSSPIWSEGIEEQFEADIYPSKIAAIRSIALKIQNEFRHIAITDSTKMPESIVIVINTPWLDLAEELKDAIINRFPEINCRIVTAISTPNPNEAILTFTSINNNETPVSQGFRKTLPTGSFRATFSNQNKSTIIGVQYVDQPWVEDFASFANSQPRKHYIVAKSNETSLSHGEASNQAMQDALSKIRLMIHSQDMNPNQIQYDDIQQSGIVVDQFVQSFNGSSRRIWRQAILLDPSQEKLKLLSEIISGANRRKNITFARMIFSVLGLFVLIIIAYAFLNFATKGYYSVTLKVVLVILAAIFLIIIFGIA